jgi:predicted AlkP superfamily pyrophosphatase or phosphodiesterase
MTDHVVVISIDGLRPDAIASFGAESIERLMREGSYTLEARTILPSTTLPSHTSMLTGAEPAAHGITWNNDRTGREGDPATPTIFELARARGFRTAAFFSKSKFHHLQVPGSLDYTTSPRGRSGKLTAEYTAGRVEQYLDEARPNLLFVHIAEPDNAGHRAGWMTASYGAAVREADWAVVEVLRAADAAFGSGKYTLILTSDHGGHDQTHGSADARDVTIPWIAWGDGVRPGAVLPSGVRTMDTAATALWLLGIVPVEPAVGVPVRAAFDGAALPRVGF